MAELAIPAAGATLGWMVGGPYGASIGWAIGSYLSSDSNIEGPKIGDLRIQTSGYGSIIPFVSGQQRVAGNVIWATDKVPHESSSGGKGFSSTPETTVVTYTISCAIAICQGPIQGITRVWEDGTLKADINSSQTKLPGTIYYGDDAQMPDPLMEAIEGAGNVPAYRGLAYIVLEDFNLGAAGRIPQFSWEVVKSQAL